jgi:peptidoglycan-N-acetylglucosamine deacetylase
MAQQSRIESRRRRRTKSTVVGVVTITVVLALLAGAGWLGWRAYASSHAARVSTAAHSQGRSTPPTSSQPTGSLAASATRTADTSQAVSSQPDSATSKAAAASISAVKRAAVSFPNAPRISASTPSINHLHPRHKYIALTLDDGYNYQPEMLALLKQYDARCTTFLVGSWAQTHKSDLEAMNDAGFEIGNHSWSHPFLTKLSSSQIRSQLTRTQRVITSVTGNQAPYLRPPYGATDSTVKSTAASLGYRIVMWNRSFGDSGRGATPKKLYANVVTAHGGVQPGDVILCHWGSKPSYEALKRILPDLQARGFQFVTISELIADSK